MGARGTEGHKNQADRVRITCAGDFRDAMAGEISPDMMFFGIRRKVTQMHVDVYGLLRIGAVGCRGMGRQENKAKGAVLLPQDVFFNAYQQTKKRRKCQRTK